MPPTSTPTSNSAGMMHGFGPWKRTPDWVFECPQEQARIYIVVYNKAQRTQHPPPLCICIWPGDTYTMLHVYVLSTYVTFVEAETAFNHGNSQRAVEELLYIPPDSNRGKQGFRLEYQRN
ncbi:uncharacterized protein MCYG_03944 [Microsporum canis CBS 113480]|uniref:Uncharacterized protein n=1 Tax=Arthroderma otae (strain ATCC MYA-4605 / CBS 113480) TaxID=554155 RepID=C5FMM2_ARTOC|nr:uncharacterized protein MCYG_03944 [Microsporum canis CBS 113480]EEQ31125.1 predicted protein [Microsporum canis CBS 113480]